MPNGAAVVCLLHLGLGVVVVLSGLVLLLSAPPVGVFAVSLGLVLLALGYGLMNLRAREWRWTIGLHAVDIVVGLVLLFGGGIEHVVGIAISSSIIVYLYSQRNLYLGDGE